MKAIEVKGIGKKYRKGKSFHGDFRSYFGNGFYFRKKGSNEDREFWALKDINFSVEQGDTLGIIGPNGSGKSTLLKILSQITTPTEGEILLRGRVSSLLEVGTGFHPELTGRENIYLNGAILGMKRGEISAHFDEIVDFSGVEDFIDTPVKHYSSGMYLRLAFSVAAHMVSDIILIDEILSVGDLEFQRKCYEKINSLSISSGKTIIIVSHNFSQILALCKYCALLKMSRLNYYGNASDTLKRYNSDHVLDVNMDNSMKIYISDIDGKIYSDDIVYKRENVVLNIIIPDMIYKGPYRLFVSIHDTNNNFLMRLYHQVSDWNHTYNHYLFHIEDIHLYNAKYVIGLYIEDEKEELLNEKNIYVFSLSVNTKNELITHKYPFFNINYKANHLTS